MDIKSQKGDSDCAAAANIFPEKILNSTAKYETDSIVDTENKSISQNKTKDIRVANDNISSDTAIKSNENIKKKKRHKNKENYRRYTTAFQQRQQKQFTYSVSYFNWAVSDEEEEDDDVFPDFSSLFHPTRSSTSDYKNAYLTGSNSFIYQRKNKRMGNEEELPIENEVSELPVISRSNKGVVLTEEFIEVTLPFKRLSIGKNRPFKR